MKRLQSTFFMSITLCLLVFGSVGCGALEDVFEKDKEASGAVEEVGSDFLVVDAISYTVTEQTTFDGVAGLTDLAIGTQVEIEYEEAGSTRTALEVEVGDSD